MKTIQPLITNPLVKGLLAILLLAACAQGLTKPGQRIYQIQSNYNAGLAIAVAYKALPGCPLAPICKKADIVIDLQEADDIAAPALASAQTCVRSKTCQNTDLAVQAANTAVAALTAITSKLVIQEAK